MTYAEMSYADLKKEASERGLPATGTKVELIARLSTSEPVPTGETPEEPVETKPVVKGAVSDRQVETAWRSDAQKMKEHLDSQRKVAIMIPLEAGVPPAVAEKIPFDLNLNGYHVSVKRGVFVEVPEQIAVMIQQRLESEGKIGSEYRIDRDPAKQEALG
mgnify:FL=1